MQLPSTIGTSCIPSSHTSSALFFHHPEAPQGITKLKRRLQQVPQRFEINMLSY